MFELLFLFPVVNQISDIVYVQKIRKENVDINVVEFNYIVIIQVDSFIPGLPISIATYSD